MTTLYKLTDQDKRTHGGYQWALGEDRTAPGDGPLCSAAWLHAYTDPLLAVLLNPIHADILSPRLFECDGDVGATDHGLKVGCTRLRLTCEIPVPEITTAQRVRFGILCAWEVCDDPAWRRWAEAWLSGADRNQAAAEAAGWAAAQSAAGERTAAERAAWAEAAGWAAAEAAARAAAAWVAAEAAAARAAEARAEARAAAEAAAEAARAAARAALDLPALARRAVEDKP
jgi:hypothetical protein